MSKNKFMVLRWNKTRGLEIKVMPSGIIESHSLKAGTYFFSLKVVDVEESTTIFEDNLGFDWNGVGNPLPSNSKFRMEKTVLGKKYRVVLLDSKNNIVAEETITISKFNKLHWFLFGLALITLIVGVIYFPSLRQFWHGHEGRKPIMAPDINHTPTDDAQKAKIATLESKVAQLVKERNEAINVPPTPPVIAPPVPDPAPPVPPTPPTNVPPVQTVATQAVSSANIVSLGAPASAPSSVYVNITAPVNVTGNTITVTGNGSINPKPEEVIVPPMGTSSVLIENKRALYWVALTDRDMITATSALHDVLPDTVEGTFHNATNHPVTVVLGWFKQKAGVDHDEWRNSVLRTNIMARLQPSVQPPQPAPAQTLNVPSTPFPGYSNAPVIQFLMTPPAGITPPQAPPAP